MTVKPAALLMLLAIASTATAQVESGRAIIAGRVRSESDSSPVGGAEVYLVGSRERQMTTDSGTFRFTGIYPGRYEVRARRIGFEQLVKFVTVAGGELSRNDWTMRLLPQQLSEVRVQGKPVTVPPYLQGAYRRAAMGFGDFLLPEDIERRNAFHTADLLDMVPGAHVSDRGPIPFVEFARCRDDQRAFGPNGGTDKIQVYVDGHMVTRMMSVSEALMSVTPKDVALVEVYRGTVRIPAEFLADACAVIAIWTKRS